MADIGYKRYPPSILIIKDSLSQTAGLKQKLERNGCQVHQINPRSEFLTKTGQEYYDVVVLEIERFNMEVLELCRKLEADLELATTPTVILTPPNMGTEIKNELEISGPIYYLCQDMFVESGLLQIIEQVRYMTYRYM